MSSSLAASQQAFLDECIIEFSDRYTDADAEYKKIYDAGIPPPPILYPWYNRSRNSYRGRNQSYRDSSHDSRRDQSYESHRDGRDYGGGRDRRYGRERESRMYRPY